MTKNKKIRLDQLLVERGLSATREKAKRLILAGEVLVSEQVADKPGQNFNPAVELRLRDRARYVSRGGDKLASVYESFQFPVSGLVFMDVGASTGGFSDFLLQNGAKLVYAVDVGTNQLDYSLRMNNQVVSLEKTHIRNLQQEQIQHKIAGFVVDVSFISISQVLGFLPVFGTDNHFLLCLIKPQFEAGRENIAKGGVVKDEEAVREILSKSLLFLQELGYGDLRLEFSRLPGPRGNVEYFCYAVYGGAKNKDFDLIDRVMQEKVNFYAHK